MTEKVDIDRIVLSRETLYKYRRIPGGTGDTPEWLLNQIRKEVDILRTILVGCPELASAIELLIEAWQDFAQALKRKTH